MPKKSIIFACRLIERPTLTKMLLQKNKHLNLTILIPPDMPMASIQNIKRPYITPAIEECFDCESDCLLMDDSKPDITGTGDNTGKGDGDWDDDFSKQDNSNFNFWDEDDEGY